MFSLKRIVLLVPSGMVTGMVAFEKHKAPRLVSPKRIVLLVPSWMKLKLEDVTLENVQMACAGETKACINARKTTKSPRRMKPPKKLSHPNNVDKKLRHGN